MIPFAPAAAPAAPTAPSAPARAGGELGAAFSALVDALTEEFLPGGEPSSTPTEPPATDAGQLGNELVDAEPTATEAAAVVAMLLAGPAPAEVASVTTDGAAGVSGSATPTGDQITPDATLTNPGDVAADTDVAPGVPGDADGSVEATATLEAAVEAGPVPPDSTPSEEVAPIGLDTVEATVEPGRVEPETLETAPPTDAADVAVEELSPADQGDGSDPSPVTTDDGPVAEGDPATPDRGILDGAADGPEVGRTDATAVRPSQPSPGPETSATAAVTGSTPPAPSAPTHAVTSASAPAEPAPAALPDQLVTVLAPLRRAPDGAHRVAIQLRPDELGELQIDVQVRGNEIALSVRADLPGTVDLLRASVAELRAQLEAAGFQPGDLDVTGRGADDATDDQRRASDTDRPTHELAAVGPTDDDAGAPPPSPSAATGLDLRL